MTTPRFCICVPARNEAERLPVLLNAIARQTIAGRIPVAICLNNCDDGSEAIVADLADRLASRLDVTVDDCILAPSIAHAGTARGRAMRLGAERLGGDGVLISTDADCRPPAQWIDVTLTAMAGGADLIGGRIEFDDTEEIAPAVRAIRARFDSYWERVRAIEDAIDPVPHDPPPRHGDHTGASLAIRRTLFDRIGGVPAHASGEDRAMVARAVAAGGRLMHPPAVWTRVSARQDGRATDGMAADMQGWASALGEGRELMVPGFEHWRRRAAWRRHFRSTAGIADMIEREECLPPMPADMPLPPAPA